MPNLKAEIHKKAKKLDDVCYEIRGAVLHTANQLEAAGNKIHKFNIGNPAPFGFDAPSTTRATRY